MGGNTGDGNTIGTVTGSGCLFLVVLALPIVDDGDDFIDVATEFPTFAAICAAAQAAPAAAFAYAAAWSRIFAS